MKQLIKTIFFAFSLSCLCSCTESNQSRPLTAQQEKVSSQDSTLAKEAIRHRSELIRKFKDTIPNETDSDYYHLIFYSSFDEGTIVKFVKKRDAYFLYVKTLNPKDSIKRLTQYTTEIDKQEWEQLESMIDEFDFWSAREFKTNRHVLDGYVYFLEGSRFTNKKRLHQLTARGSPRYDKIGALCDYIMEYKDELVFKYKQVQQ